MSRSKDRLTPIGDILTPKLVKQIKRRSGGPTPIEKRLIEGAAYRVENPDEAQSLVFQHTVLCQTCLPFRDPGDEVRTWERLNGNVHLEVNAGKAMHPEQGRLVALGLPFGPKARMILMHINQQALKQKTPEIEVQDSLTKFVRRTLNLDPKGRNMRIVKEQLGRLSAASITLGVIRDGHALTVNSHIVTAFDIWFPKDEHQRVLWPSTIRLSLDYWESLKTHAVPLDEDHIARLSHSALALDIYAWLANRLHRVPANAPARISWAALHGQFGQGYGRVDNFRAAFRVALREVLALYQMARIDLHEERKPARVYSQGGKPVLREPPAKGLTLYNSPPPVSRRIG
jgi:Plasmid encoded RepA protein